jgi:hypothetical protein
MMRRCGDGIGTAPWRRGPAAVGRLGLGLVLLTLWSATLVAQGRSATIRVSATVVDVAQWRVIGGEAAAPVLRLSAGRSGELAVRVEGRDGRAWARICAAAEDSDRSCQVGRSSAAHMRGGGTRELLVSLAPPGTPRDGDAGPVRVVVAYTAI